MRKVHTLGETNGTPCFPLRLGVFHQTPRFPHPGTPAPLFQPTISASSGFAAAMERLASHADVLRLVTRSSLRTSAQLSDHFRSLAVSLCFGRTNRESVVIGMSG